MRLENERKSGAIWCVFFRQSPNLEDLGEVQACASVRRERARLRQGRDEPARLPGRVDEVEAARAQAQQYVDPQTLEQERWQSAVDARIRVGGAAQ